MQKKYRKISDQEPESEKLLPHFQSASKREDNLKLKLHKVLLATSNSPPSGSYFSKMTPGGGLLKNLESSGEKSNKSRNVVKENLTSKAVKKEGDLQVLDEDTFQKNVVLT